MATGTGSGKTESFLLPVLSALTAEHAAGTLGPGVRALLLYPMNALANDQLRRLRQRGACLPMFSRVGAAYTTGRRICHLLVVERRIRSR